MCFPHQLDEATLETRAGEGGRAVESERSTQASGARMAAGAGEDCVDRTKIKQAQLFGKLDRPLETVGRQRGGKIEQSSRDSGNRNALMEGAVVRGETGMMEGEPCPAPSPGRRGDVDCTGALSEKSPEPRCGYMAEQSAGGGGEHGRKAATVPREMRMADCVYTPMKTVQTAGCSRPADRALRITKRTKQLADRYDAVLALCQIGEIQRVRLFFLPHSG